MFHTSSRPHLALMASGLVAAVLLSFLLIVGWRRHLDMVERKLVILQAEKGMVKRVRPAPLAPPVVALPSQEPVPLTPAPAPLPAAKPASTPSLNLMDLARTDGDAPLFPEALPLASPISEPRETDAQSTLHKFLQAQSWQDKLPWVADSDRVQGAMRDFYEVRKHSEPSTSGPARQAGFRINDTEVLLFSFASTRPGEVTDVALTARNGEPFKVDWESFVGASDMNWADFKGQRVTKPQLFRVFAQFDDYHNYEFSDAAKFMSVHLSSPDGLYFLYGFCLRDSAVGRTLSTLQTSAPTRMALTLRLAFSPQADSDHCVHITGVVANRWLLVP